MTIALVEFSEAEIEIRAVRDTVFGDEQNVPQEINWDGNDEECLHVLARGKRGKVVATGRLAPDGKIGRLAVLRRRVPRRVCGCVPGGSSGPTM